MSQKGEHTWDIIIDYQRCPQCNFIVENRDNYQIIDGKIEKKLECPRCHHHFVVVKAKRKKFGPLFGNPQSVEINWDEFTE